MAIGFSLAQMGSPYERALLILHALIGRRPGDMVALLKEDLLPSSLIPDIYPRVSLVILGRRLLLQLVQPPQLTMTTTWANGWRKAFFIGSLGGAK